MSEFERNFNFIWGATSKYREHTSFSYSTNFDYITDSYKYVCDVYKYGDEIEKIVIKEFTCIRKDGNIIFQLERIKTKPNDFNYRKWIDYCNYNKNKRSFIFDTDF